MQTIFTVKKSLFQTTEKVTKCKVNTKSSSFFLSIHIGKLIFEKEKWYQKNVGTFAA